MVFHALACAMQRAFYVTYFITPPGCQAIARVFLRFQCARRNIFTQKKSPFENIPKRGFFLRAGHVRRGISVCDRLRARR